MIAGLPQLRFAIFLIGYVAHRTDQTPYAAVGAAQSDRLITHPAVLTAADPDAVLVLQPALLALEQRAQGRPVAGGIVWMEAIEPFARANNDLRKIKQGFQAVGDVQQVRADRPVVDSLAHRACDELVALLFFFESDFDAADAGDILVSEQQAAVRHRSVAGEDLTAADQFDLDVLRGTIAHSLDPLGDLLLGQPGPVVAARRVVQEQLGQRHARPTERLGIAAQVAKRLVAED